MFVNLFTMATSDLSIKSIRTTRVTAEQARKLFEEMSNESRSYDDMFSEGSDSNDNFSGIVTLK